MVPKKLLCTFINIPHSFQCNSFFTYFWDCMHNIFQIVFISFLLFFFHLNATGQSTRDSIEFSLNFEKDPIVKIELLEQISRKLKYSDTDKSLNYANDAFQISNEINDVKEIINSSLLISDIYWIKANYEEARNWAILAEQLSKKNNIQKGLARSYLIMGAIYSNIDNYDRSSEYYFKSLKIFQNLNDRKFEGIVLNNIGNIFSDQKKYDKAAEYFSEAYNIATEVKDSVGVIIGLTNYASVLSNLEEYEKAKNMMEKAISISKNDELNPWFGANVLNLAIVNQQLKNYDTALILFNTALDIFNRLEDESYVARCYYYVANYYYETEDYQKSISYATNALGKGRRYGFKKVVLDAANLLRKNYINLNMTTEAYKYSLIRYNVKDSLYMEENITKLSNIELQYDFDKKQQEKRIEQQRKDFIIIIVIISLILVIIVVVSILTRQRIKAKNTLLAKQKLEMELDSKNKEFATNVLYLMKKNELLSEISERLIQVEKEAVKDETKSALHKIGLELKRNKEKDIWEEFEIRFTQVHTQFYENLTKQFPELTSNDLRICAFLKLNMSSKEISEITGQRVATLESARSRIRKKLDISKTQVDLVTFLSKF